MNKCNDLMDQLLAPWRCPHAPGGVLALIQNREIVYRRAFGLADLERQVEMHPDAAFDLCSTGKQFTAMLAALLADEGALDFTSAIRRYIPEMPAWSDAITIRHLLYHTSGLRDYTLLMKEAGLAVRHCHEPAALLQLLCNEKGTLFTPGTAYDYCNSGYFLLGLILERITGRDLCRLLAERIFVPLNMRATTCNDDFFRLIPNRALGYAATADGGYRNDFALGGGLGDGAIITTAADLCLWDRNFYANQLGGGQELIRRLTAPGTLDDGTPLSYAMGLIIGTHRGQRTINHPGSWTGYSAELLRFPDLDFSVVCLANRSDFATSRLAYQAADGMLETGNWKLETGNWKLGN